MYGYVIYNKYVWLSHEKNKYKFSQKLKNNWKICNIKHKHFSKIGTIFFRHTSRVSSNVLALVYCAYINKIFYNF